MREVYSFDKLDQILGEMNFRHSSQYDVDVNKGDTVEIARFDTEKRDIAVERVKVVGDHDDKGRAKTIDGEIINVHQLPRPGMCGFRVIKSPYWKKSGYKLEDVGWRPHSFPRTDLSVAKKGDFVITRFMEGHPKKLIAAQRIEEIVNDGFKIVGEAGQHYFLREDEFKDGNILLARLPYRFSPPLNHDRVYEVGGIYIPKSQGKKLHTFSKESNFQLSLAYLGLPYTNSKSIERTLERFPLK